jgi:hypothetical protein
MPTDKLLHLLAGSTIAAVAYPFGIFWASLAVFIAAIGKEAWDSTGRGHVELLDALATVAGGALLLGWYLLLNHPVLPWFFKVLGMRVPLCVSRVF